MVWALKGPSPKAYDIGLSPQLTDLLKIRLVKGSEGIGACPWRSYWHFRVSLFFELPGWNEVNYMFPVMMLWYAAGPNDGMNSDGWKPMKLWANSFSAFYAIYMLIISGTFSQWQKETFMLSITGMYMGNLCEDLSRTQLYDFILSTSLGIPSTWHMTQERGLTINVCRMNKTRWIERC